MKYVKLIDGNPKFCKPIDYGWVLKVESLEDLMTYEEISKGKWHNTFIEWSKAYEKKAHYTPRSFSLELTAMNKEVSILDAMGIMCGEDLKNKIRCINRDGCIYVQYRNATSYFSPSKHTIELEKKRFVDNGSLWVPKEPVKARYMQWPNGTHWYAKVGEVDVVVDGEQKWETKKEAKKAVRKWKKENQEC